MFKDALKEAEVLDAEFARTKQLKGPLHGLPVSFKDQYDITGYDSTIGYTQWTNDPATSDADLVKLTRAAGGIPLFKTNVPQTMLSFECSNPLWGRTINPYSAAHTCGGSSGGEGAALAMDAAAFGWGSDIGGSLRMPAHYCGIYALKPGTGRITRGGARGGSRGFDGIPSVVGPMGRSVGDIELACRAVFGQEGRNYLPAPIPYREVNLPEKLKFGYYTSDGFVRASPACRRAVLQTVEALRAQGHECIEFQVPGPARALEIFIGLTSADGYKGLLSHLGPDPKEPAMFITTLGPRLPGWLRGLASWIFRTFVGDSIFSSVLSASRIKPVAEYHELAYQRDQYIAEFYAKVWDKYGFDGIIAPTQSLPAIPHNGCKTLSPLANATLLYNVVDSPVGCVPVTRVDSALDKLTPEWESTGLGSESKVCEQRVFGAGGVYDAETMNGLPVGVQVIGKRWEEEKVVALMGVVDEALGPSRGFGPSAWSKWKEAA